jgi:hypothetical protein
MEQKVTPPWTKGLIISLILIVYGIVLYFAGQSMNKSLSWIQFIVLDRWYYRCRYWFCQTEKRQCNIR